jgi:hypothetical protein
VKLKSVIRPCLPLGGLRSKLLNEVNTGRNRSLGELAELNDKTMPMF